MKFKIINILFILFAFMLVSMGFMTNTICYGCFTILGILWLGLTVIGSFSIQFNYFLKAKHSIVTEEKIVAISFDDGPHPDITEKVLDELKKHNTKANFFLIGRNAKKYPEIVKRIEAEGHCIGNHSYAHSNNYGFLSTQKIIADIKKNSTIIKEITGIDTPWFRPPFGVTNPRIAKAVKLLDKKVIGWRVRSYDTVAKDVSKVIERITIKLRKGDIILLHDTSELSLQVLVQLLSFIEKENYKTVKFDDVMK